MKKEEILGTIRFWIDRLSWYVQKISVVMIFVIFFTQQELSWWWLLSLPVLLYGAFRFEKALVVGGDLASYMRNNPEWIEMKQSLAAIRKHLGIELPRKPEEQTQVVSKLRHTWLCWFSNLRKGWKRTDNPNGYRLLEQCRRCGIHREVR